MLMQKVNLAEQFSLITDYWNPKIAGQLNGQHVKLVKFKGPFIWHQHEKEDEFFLVIKGSFIMEFRNKQVELREGEFLIVPRGVERLPNATAEVWVMLFEPEDTLNTGNIENELTKKTLETI